MEHQEAIASFQKAVRHDPGFAMAYYYLSLRLDPALIHQAMEHLDRAGRVEQYYIRSRFARVQGDFAGAIDELRRAVELFPDEQNCWSQLGFYLKIQGNLNEAIECYEKAAELDPMFKTAFNELAYLYDRVGRPDRAIEAINRYVELAPDEANPYDSKGDILSRQGDLEGAIAAFERAVEIAPDFHKSRMYLGFLYMFAGRYAEADSCFQALTYADNPSTRYAAYFYAVYPSLRRGHLQEALKLIDESLALFNTPRALRLVPHERLHSLRLRVAVLCELGDYDGALAAVDECRKISSSLSPPDTVGFRDYRVILLAERGELEEAERELAALEEIIAATGQDYSGHWLAVGVLAWQRGDLDSALAAMQRGVEMEPSFLGRYYLGRAYLAAEKPQRAIDTFNALLKVYDSPRSFHGIESVRIHYHLGLAYEQLGQTEEAVEQFSAFLDIWRDADHNPAALDDARRRLDRLRSLP
jgi:superkiller protein 3